MALRACATGASVEHDALQELLSLASHGNDPARVGEELEKFCRAHEDHAGRQEGDIAAARVLADVLDRTGGWVGDDLRRGSLRGAISTVITIIA